MLMDNRGRLFGKVNIIDMLVLLVVLLIISGVISKFALSDDRSVKSNPNILQYTVSIADIRNYSADALNVGDKLYDAKTGTYMGEIINKEVKPQRDYITKTNGTIVQAEKPNRLEVLLTIEVPGVENETGYLAGGNRDINRMSSLQLENQIIGIQLARVVDVKKIR
jgi:hypothetical protein